MTMDPLAKTSRWDHMAQLLPIQVEGKGRRANTPKYHIHPRSSKPHPEHNLLKKIPLHPVISLTHVQPTSKNTLLDTLTHEYTQTPI